MIDPAARKPPLSVWIAAMLVAVALLLMLGNIDRMSWLSESVGRTTRFNLQRLQAVPPGVLHVVALGTSKTMYAMDFDDAFAARIALPGRRVVFHRLTASSPEFNDMQPALEALVRHPPDVLLVEAELLLIDRNDRATVVGLLNRARQNLLMMRAQLPGEFINRGVNNNHGREDWPLDARCLSGKTQEAMRAYADYAARWQLASDDERTAYLVYLRRIQATGTRVVLLRLPRSPSGEKVAPAGLMQQSAQLRARLLKEEGFTGWEPDVMAESLYCDQIHVNRRGRDYYSAWLAKQLLALLGQLDV